MHNHLNILTLALPEAERENANGITLNYTYLEGCLSKLEAALALFDHCVSLRMPLGPMERLRERRDHNLMMDQWQLMAARTGALAIYEFHRVEQAIDKLISRSPTLQPMVDSKARRRASKLFDKAFPDFAGIRHFAAHGSEMTALPEKAKQHEAQGPVTVDGLVLHAGRTLISGTLVNRTYASTYEGKTVSYALIPQTVENLRISLDARYRVLVPIEKAALEMLRHQVRERRA